MTSLTPSARAVTRAGRPRARHAAERSPLGLVELAALLRSAAAGLICAGTASLSRHGRGRA